MKLPTGKSVWHQPDAGHPDGFLLVLTIQNSGQDAEKVTIFDRYGGKTEKRTMQTGHTATVYAELHKSYGWYDLTVNTASDAGFSRQLARHVDDRES